MANGQLNGVVRQIRKLAGWQDFSQLSDGQLLDRFIKDQDETAFEAIVQRHGPMVLGVCRRMLNNTQDAEDAFQATFVVLVRKAASINPRDMVSNWLYGVACRAALKARSMNCKRRSKEFQMFLTAEPFSSPGDVWHDVREVLDEELERLPDKYRGAVVLCDLQGKSRKDAAELLKIPEGTLSSRLNTGRQMLAKKLARRGVVLSAGGLATLLADNVASAAASITVPSALIAATVKAGHVAATGSLALGAISGQAAAVADGVVRGMLLAKLKLAGALLVTVTLMTGSVGYYYSMVSTPGGGGHEPAPRAEPKSPEAMVAKFPGAAAVEGLTPVANAPGSPTQSESPAVAVPKKPEPPTPPVLNIRDQLKQGDAAILKIRQDQLRLADAEEKRLSETIKAEQQALKNGDLQALARVQKLTLELAQLGNYRRHVESGIAVGGTKSITPPMPSLEQMLGIHCTPPTPLLAKQLGLPKNQGVVIEKVEADSPASTVGLAVHDILLKIDGKPVPSDRKEFKKFLNDIPPDTAAPAVVLRAGKEQTIPGLTFPPGPRPRPAGFGLSQTNLFFALPGARKDTEK